MEGGLAAGSAANSADEFTEIDRQRLRALLALDAPRGLVEYRELARLSLRAANRASVDREERWTPKDDAEMLALLQQYQSLRAESASSVTNRVQTLSLGIAAIGAVTAGTLTAQNLQSNAILVHAVFSGAVPLVGAFVLLVWLSEAIRSHRVGYFLAADIESRINAKLGRFVMCWESALWAEFLPRDERFGPSMMALVVVGLVAGLAPPFGIVLAPTTHTVALIAVPYGFLLSVVVYTAYQLIWLKNVPIVVSVFTSGRAIARE